jgi:hypothetical protein
LFWGVLLYLVGAFLVPRSCERACSSCPWDQGGEQRRRYWAWRVRLGTLEVILDAGYVVFCLGRVACDLVLAEATWTLPLFAAAGALLTRSYLRDLRELDRVRDRAREVGA